MSNCRRGVYCPRLLEISPNCPQAAFFIILVNIFFSFFLFFFFSWDERYQSFLLIPTHSCILWWGLSEEGGQREGLWTFLRTAPGRRFRWKKSSTNESLSKNRLAGRSNPVANTLRYVSALSITSWSNYHHRESKNYRSHCAVTSSRIKSVEMLSFTVCIKLM